MDSSTKEKISEILKKFFKEYQIPGMSCVISKKEKIIFEKDLGVADLENETPITKNTILRVGSISKSFTSVGITKLLKKEKLSISEPIQSFKKISYPKGTFGDKEYGFSVAQILSHFSGLRDYCPKEVEYYSQKNYPNVKDFLKDYKKDQLLSKPGTTWKYSTFSYSVLQMLMEEYSGMSYGEYMKKNLFEPLKMKDTKLDKGNQIVKNRGRYYLLSGPDNNKVVNSPYVDLSCKFAGGGFLSSCASINLFGNGILYNKEIKDTLEYFGAFKKTRTDLSDKATNYGLGWFIKSVKETDIYFHTGNAVGCTTACYVIPKKEIVISLVTNLQDVKVSKIVNNVMNELDIY